jgi:anti-sigma regulatory factor (Ser/Thr protein kinase)
VECLSDIRSDDGGSRRNGRGVAPAPLTLSPAGESDQFEHLGLRYRGDAEYMAGTTAFVRSALDAGDPVLVAVPGRNLDLVRDGLGEDAWRVEFADMAAAGRNPGRIISGVLLAFTAANPGRRVWIVGEPVWPGRTPIEYPACAAHEALINVAFTGRDAAILCPYDAARLDAVALADAEHTHPIMAAGSVRWRSAAYADPVATAATFNRPLPDPPAGAAAMHFHGNGALAFVRRFLAGQARAAGLGESRVADLAIAVNELATNTSEHGGGAGLLRVWTEGDTLVCQVSDEGHLLDPLAGRLPPAFDQARGRGLFMVNQLCDLVRVYTRPAGTEIRVHMTLPPA